MSEALDAAKKLLAQVEDRLPFRVNEATNPDEDPVIATIRDVAGWPVIAPHPEAVSMITGKRPVIEFFVFAPKVIRDLIDEIEAQKAD